MKRALQLAARGRGYTSPNPMVGAVIVYDGKIIGEGYHRKYGQPHAEVNAINSVSDKSLLEKSTIYVTLEPCSHYGKTPPCSQLIIDSRIPKVVVGCLDPFEKVRGRGVKMLRDNGVEVVTGVLEKECVSLNAQFITAHTYRRPWVTLKWAQSSDCFIDKYRMPGESAAKFSNRVTTMLTHKLRSLHDGIMVGANTVIEDNPRLDVRYYSGRNPRIVVADRRGLVSAQSSVFGSSEPVMYLSSVVRADLANAQYVPVGLQDSVADYLKALYDNGITSLLVEGGSMLIRSFIEAALWDVARVETSPIVLGQDGKTPSPPINATPIRTCNLNGNRLEIYCRNTIITSGDISFCNFV